MIRNGPKQTMVIEHVTCDGPQIKCFFKFLGGVKETERQRQRFQFHSRFGLGRNEECEL